jgi:transcriptional regulator with XRE-family HTH domain
MPKVRLRSDVVREHLVRRNISQNYLALRSGVSQGYLSQLLRGHRSPGPQVRKRLMSVLKLANFEDLFIVCPDSSEARSDAPAQA